MSRKIIFVHGMFQNPKSWDNWVSHLSGKGFECTAVAWPFHEGEPADLRADPPAGLGRLRLQTVIDTVVAAIGTTRPIVIGHSVGGLIAQILLNRGLASAAVAVSSVAPNGIIDFDFTSLKNIAVIANPLKGDEPVMTDLETFHGTFANTLSKSEVAYEFERTATHDSRNVLRDCMGSDGKIDLKEQHGPLLLIGGEKDQIIPQHLVEKNARAYDETTGTVTFKPFAGRSHYICNEPGWEGVCSFAAQWLDNNVTSGSSAKLNAA